MLAWMCSARDCGRTLAAARGLAGFPSAASFFPHSNFGRKSGFKARLSWSGLSTSPETPAHRKPIASAATNCGNRTDAPQTCHRQQDPLPLLRTKSSAPCPYSSPAVLPHPSPSPSPYYCCSRRPLVSRRSRLLAASTAEPLAFPPPPRIPELSPSRQRRPPTGGAKQTAPPPAPHSHLLLPPGRRRPSLPLPRTRPAPLAAPAFFCTP